MNPFQGHNKPQLKPMTAYHERQLAEPSQWRLKHEATKQDRPPSQVRSTHHRQAASTTAMHHRETEQSERSERNEKAIEKTSLKLRREYATTSRNSRANTDTKMVTPSLTLTLIATPDDLHP